MKSEAGLHINNSVEKHDEKPADSMNGTASKSPAENPCNESATSTLVNGRLLRKFGTVAGILLVFLLSITLLAFVISSDIRAAQQLTSPLVSFQHGQDTRSTMDIVYSCLSTMVICSVSAIHFNLPGENFGPFEMPKGKKARMTITAAFWFIGLLMPDTIVYLACMEYQTASIDFEHVTKTDSYPGWSLKHSFFTKMGGFVELEETGSKQTIKPIKDGIVVASSQRGRLKEIGRDIADKSKKDSFSKCIATIQIGRFLLGMIARAATSLPISPLEYFTCAQVGCALLMYIFWFSKPHNVQEPMHVPVQSEGSSVTGQDTSILDKLQEPANFVLRYLVTCYGAVLVGASALSQWNAQFSTHTSQVLWRTFSIVSAVLPLLIVIAAWKFRLNKENTKKLHFVLYFFLGLHFLNRLILIGIVFYAFSNLQADVYKTVNWFSFLSFIQ